MPTMTKPTTVKLTEKEIELLQHRWEVPDAIDDVFEEQRQDPWFANAIDRAYDAVGVMLMVRAVHVPFPEVAIMLKELAEGSTWVACCTDESDSVKRAANRTANGLEKKLAALGIDVHIPR